jgi:hypothetical protein
MDCSKENLYLDSLKGLMYCDNGNIDVVYNVIQNSIHYFLEMDPNKSEESKFLLEKLNSTLADKDSFGEFYKKFVYKKDYLKKGEFLKNEIVIDYENKYNFQIIISNNQKEYKSRGKVYGLKKTWDYLKPKTKENFIIVVILDDRHTPTRNFFSCGLYEMIKYKIIFCQFAHQYNTLQSDPLGIQSGGYFYFDNIIRDKFHGTCSQGKFINQ